MEKLNLMVIMSGVEYDIHIIYVYHYEHENHSYFISYV